MNRLLITLLALMTGLVAQVSPAATAVRSGGETEIGASATRVDAQAKVRELSLAPHRMAAILRPNVQQIDRVAGLRLANTTVLTGIDRARE